LSGQETIDSLGLPGDHFSLEGALELFKNSNSLEEFEKKLNEEENYVNNLDLNEDGEVDYIRVEDHMEGNAHAIVLQVPVSEDEAQDVAVIEIEKTSEESALLQIIGDETLYGDNYIVEPFEEEASSDGKGPNARYRIMRITVNVWFWSPVRTIYSPGYRVYISPWRWAAYPRWWSPWRPHPYRWHYNKRVVYRPFYRPVKVHRVTVAHRVYTPRKKSSVTVKSRTIHKKTTVQVNKKSVTAQSTTTKVRSNGNTIQSKKTNSEVGVKKDKNGNIKAGKKTTTKSGATDGNKSVKKKKTTTTKVKKKGTTTKAKKKTTTKTKKKKNN
jgi:hypothetical protein